MCALYHPGHRTHPIQANKGSRDRAHWRDALATFYADGGVTLHIYESGERIEVWHHASLQGSAADGIPVQYHEELHLLRVEHLLASVARTDR